MDKEKFLHEFMDHFQKNVPPALSGFAQLCKEQLRQSVAAVLRKMDVVSREEFDIQVLLLRKSRERLESIEKQLATYKEGQESK